ncbi:MAG: LuxR C-terminal-related transcriptional regulator [Spirochaetaceae bacterium]|jgi:LuxR family maltose regulon positive regulatory protein|nr:LuxR C-terminal-related transcriptional regulator [Spirochaetaceae bacterium]
MSDTHWESPGDHFLVRGVSPPVDNQPYLIRPRLHQLLDQAVRKRLVTVVAGEGYGKTRLVYSYLQSAPFKIVWIPLSEQDNHSPWFWENFIRGVAFINPETAAKMTENGFPETREQFDRFLLIPRQDIKPDIKYIFVYDNFHLIHHEPVLNFLDWIFNASIRNVGFMALSRKEPAIHTVNLLSKGVLLKISEDELRFSLEEMLEYFRLEGLTVPAEAADNLYRDTEGWAFAIRLAILALKNGGGGDYGRGFLRRRIFDRIAQELFLPLSEDEQKNFIKCSLVERLSPKLITEISGDPAFVEKMENFDSFIRYDFYLDTYRFHRLLLEYLSGKQDRLTGEEKRKVYILAASGCLENDQKMDAIAYYEKAGAYDELMHVVYTLPQVLPKHQSRFLLDLMDRAPEELYRTSPRALILHTRLLFILGRLEEAGREVRRIIKEFEAQPLSAKNSWVLYGSYNNLGFIGKLTSPFTQKYDFAAAFEKAYHYYRLSGVEIRGIITVSNLGSYACRVGAAAPGEMEKYIQALADSEPYVTASMNGCTAGQADLARAEIAYFRGDFDNVVQFAYQALYKARKKNQYEIETRIIFYLLRLSIARGKYSRTKEFFDLLEAQLNIKEYRNRAVFYDIVFGWFYAHIGQTGKIAPWLLDDFGQHEASFLMQGQEVLVRLKRYLAEKNYAAALRLIEQHKPSLGLGAFLLGKLEMKVLEAVCFYHEKRPEAAREALEAAYEMAHPDGLSMPFIELGNHTRLLVMDALKDKNSRIPRPWLEMILNNASAYAKKIFVSIQKYGEWEQEDAAPDTVLSSRERKVLIGLSRGLTREEIARDAALSLNTVKMTISALYDKLDAVNRADAIRIATIRGILKVDD